MRMDHDPAPRSIFPRFGFRYWPKTVIRSKCSEWLLRAQSAEYCAVRERQLFAQRNWMCDAGHKQFHGKLRSRINHMLLCYFMNLSG